MQRFQSAYPLLEIPEVQKYLHHVLSSVQGMGDLQDLYRRRLVSCFSRGVELSSHDSFFSLHLTSFSLGLDHVRDMCLIIFFLSTLGP